MIFQIRRLKFHILIALIVFVLLPVMPVSADSFNTYYKVAPNISQGSTIFIGEEGLDITNALATANAAGTPTNISTIGWWASLADLHASRPTVSCSLINRTTNFTVNQTEFDGYEGGWYLVDADNNNYAKPGTGPVFTVSAPKVNLTIRDPFRIGGTDVSGMSVLRGEGLQFQIGTNMYTVLANPSLRSPIYNTTGSGANSDGFLDIIVKDETGTTITHLYDDNNLERTLIALNVTTQPYTWGMSNAGSGPDIDYMWSTLAYPQGTHTVSVRSKLNNMYSNYLSGSAAYTGRTVSETKTITLVNSPITSAMAGTGVYRPGAGFYLDRENDSAWNPSTDVYQAWDNAAGDLPIAGDWNGEGIAKTGVYRPGVGFFLKMDNGSTWSPATDVYLAWDNAAGDLPIAGDWNRDGRTETGVYRPGAGFYLKMDNGSSWNSSTDKFLPWDNAANDLPIAGDWNGDHRTETGVYRPGAGFYLKTDNGSTWTPSTDVYLAWDNAEGDLPIAGDWNGDGRTETGVYRPGVGFFLKEFNGNSWTASTDRYLAWDNAYGDLPIAGKFWERPTQLYTRIFFASDLTITPSTNASIPVGGKVIWENGDPFHPHGVVATDTLTGNYFGGMSPMQIPYGKTFEVTFDTVGEFTYETTFQPQVAGSVIVY